MNLNEVKNLVSTLDEEAMRKGKTPLPSMTLHEAVACQSRPQRLSFLCFDTHWQAKEHHAIEMVYFGVSELC